MEDEYILIISWLAYITPRHVVLSLCDVPTFNHFS